MVKIIVIDGQTTTNYEITWQDGMNVLDALIANHASYDGFTYALAGRNFVTMINGKYESPNIRDVPYYYWEIFRNGSYATVGIDFIFLLDGDTVTFEYAIYNPAHHPESTVHARINSLKNLPD